MPSIAQMLGSIAENMVQKLNKINASLAKQGQSAANTFDDVSSKIEAIKSGANVSGVTASETDVLVTKIFVNSSGVEKEGIMSNNGAVRQTLSVSQPNYDIPKGYHNGLGYVKIQTQEKTVTPQSYAQIIEPDQDKVLSKVIVEAVQSQGGGFAKGVCNTSISNKLYLALPDGAPERIPDFVSISMIFYNDAPSNSRIQSATIVQWSKSTQETTFIKGTGGGHAVTAQVENIIIVSIDTNPSTGKKAVLLTSQSPYSEETFDTTHPYFYNMGWI